MPTDTPPLADPDDLDWVYSAAPGTGEVQAWSSDGSTWFVNPTINHWLCSLHMVGSWLTSSTVIGRWDEDGQAEEKALAELADLLERIMAFDPPAFGDGDHATHFWPAVLDPVALLIDADILFCRDVSASALRSRPTF